MIFHLQSGTEIKLFAVTSESFIVVPAITGGFVGRLFVVPTCYPYELTQDVAAIMIISQEACKVEIYDLKTTRKVDEKTFSEVDIAKDVYWFFKIGKIREGVSCKEYRRHTSLMQGAGDMLIHMT